MLKGLTDRMKSIPSTHTCSADPQPIDSARLLDPLVRIFLALLSSTFLICSLPQPEHNSLFAEYQPYVQNNQRVQKSLQPAPTLLESLAPSIVSPTAGSLFLSMTSVPIKLYPPRRTTVSMYTVKVERKDSRGAWIMVTNLPVSLAQASSLSGYVGWGTGGPDGRSLSLMASPGTYRISTQVSAPLQTG